MQSIWKANLDGSGAIPFVTGLGNPGEQQSVLATLSYCTAYNQFFLLCFNTVAIAVDWITDKIYWASVSPPSNTISVADIHVGYRTLVIDLSSFEPNEILVDASNRCICV